MGAEPFPFPHYWFKFEECLLKLSKRRCASGWSPTDRRPTDIFLIHSFLGSKIPLKAALELPPPLAPDGLGMAPDFLLPAAPDGRGSAPEFFFEAVAMGNPTVEAASESLF